MSSLEEVKQAKLVSPEPAGVVIPVQDPHACYVDCVDAGYAKKT